MSTYKGFTIPDDADPVDVSQWFEDFADSAAPLTGATFTGNVTVVSPTAADSAGVRQITISTSNPTGGADGDIWITFIP